MSDRTTFTERAVAASGRRDCVTVTPRGFGMAFYARQTPDGWALTPYPEHATRFDGPNEGLAQIREFVKADVWPGATYAASLVPRPPIPGLRPPDRRLAGEPVWECDRTGPEFGYHGTGTGKCLRPASVMVLVHVPTAIGREVLTVRCDQHATPAQIIVPRRSPSGQPVIGYSPAPIPHRW